MGVRLSVIVLLFVASAASASDVVSKLEKTYSGAKGIQARFVQKTYIEIMNSEDVKRGRLFIEKGKFRIEYQTPYEQYYVFDGKALWIYTPGYKEVEYYEKGVGRLSQEALVFLDGLGDLRKNFKITSESFRENKIDLNLAPKDSGSTFKSMRLVARKDTFLIEEIVLRPKGGNKSVYRFSDFRLDLESPPGSFTFKPPSGVIVRRPDA